MRTKAINLLLVSIALVVGCLLLEIIVRVFNVNPMPMDTLPVPTYQLSANPLIRYEYIPGYQSKDAYFDDSHRGFEINDAGFRDYNYDLAKPDGVFRILMMGDSTTVGNGVPDLENTYTKILERELNATESLGKRFEVLNMGVGGYQTVQEVETLRVKGLPYNPDLVFLTVCVNDFSLHADGGVFRRLIQLKEGGSENTGPTLLGSILRNSRLAFVIYYRFWVRIFNPDRWYIENALRGKSTVEAGFELISKLQGQHELPVRILVLPTFSVPFDEYDSYEYHDRVRDATNAVPSIEIIDLLDMFANREEPATELSFDGLHMNERGHQVMAELILPIAMKIAEVPDDNP